MIIRNRDEAYVMIEQDHHAELSKMIMTYWSGTDLNESPQKNSILYAIKNHDVGWAPFDNEPFLNDADNTPYAFTDFPVSAKTVLYTNGINQVEAVDSYAGLLCSEHYTRFMQNRSEPIAQTFVTQEQHRQTHLQDTMPDYDAETFATHYDLLKLADNLSLYICLNEPGTSKDQIHPFFKNGIGASGFIQQGYIDACWRDDRTIILNPFPFTQTIDLTLQETIVSKQLIEEKGLITAYQATPAQTRHIRLAFE